MKLLIGFGDSMAIGRIDHQIKGLVRLLQRVRQL
jgi:hypothetical protein